MYGENSDALRAQLSMLLRQHRIQHRIGGAGIPTAPVTTTVTEREELGQLIQRYRSGLLTWCRQALDSAGANRRDARVCGNAPEVQLLRCLLRTLGAVTASVPSMEDLTRRHDFPLVDAWRRAAQAAVLGEHDFAGELADGRLDFNQRLTVVKDAAEVIRALIVLDRRYGQVPGWEPLVGGLKLERAAEACAFVEDPDYSVDLRGWRPPARTIDGPPRPGVAGVVQAQYNVLIHLNGFPNVTNLRRLLDAQRELSHLLAKRVSMTAPEPAPAWNRRATTYATLHREARNLGGRIGSGGAAVAEAANAVNRLRRLPPDKPLSERALRDLTLLCNGVDERLAGVFEQGVRERLYLARVIVPRIVADDGAVTHRVRERFMPITTPLQTDLVRLVREQLRPAPTSSAAPPGARASRLELEVARCHRPGQVDDPSPQHRLSL